METNQENLTEEQKELQRREEERKREEEQKEADKKARRRRRRMNELLIIIIIILLLLTRCSLYKRALSPLTPDYPPQGTEENQDPIDGDNSEKMDSEEGGGAINVTYGMNATVKLSEDTVTLYYANPNASNQNVAVLILIDELVVAKSDLITPGHQVTELPLEPYAKEVLMVGGYDAELVVRAYNPDTGEKAMIDTKGEVTLTVIE